MARPMPRLAPVTKATRLNIVLLRKSVNFKHSNRRSWMAYADLREFIKALEKNKELRRVSIEVDPVLEITEFADRAVKGGGPALLFEKPKGSGVPVLINAFASMKRMELAMEVNSVDEVAARIVEFLEMGKKPDGLLGKLKLLPKLAEAGS